WRFISRMIVILFLISPIICDYTSFHLRNHLNHSVSPCSDFYSHVCPNNVHRNQTVVGKSEKYYKEMASRLKSQSRKNAILKDISSARKGGNCTFKLHKYKAKLSRRCGRRISCYRNEFTYFFNIYEQEFDLETPHHPTKHFASRSTNNITEIIRVTSLMIESLMEEYMDDFDSIVAPYEQIRDRIAIITEMKKRKTTINSVMRRVQEMGAKMKALIVDKFKETPWLHETNELGLNRLSVFLTILDEMKISTDFDKYDSNLNTWRKFDRDFSKEYLKHKQRSTGCFKFDVIHPFKTHHDKLEDNLETSEIWEFFTRITDGLVYNGIHDYNTNSILLLAPLFYLLLWKKSGDTTYHGLGATLGHEIFHSFVRSELMEIYDVYNNESECIKSHFNMSCSVWSESTCKSGKQTFEEDGPDLEGMRVAYDLMLNSHTDQELKELEYEELGITREQSFFYAAAVHSCVENFDDFDDEDEHSRDNIRVNAVVSLMPEFTAAFGCKRGEEEYSEEKSSCYLFGPRAGLRMKEEEKEKEEEADEEYEEYEEGSESKEENDETSEMEEDKEQQ
ncbi:hypothetical protein PMAYCL1PPCAC_19035, partial [Pristionchus mayeri]